MKILKISLNRCRLSKITHYEQRLRTLHYKKKFNIWYSELKPKIMAVLEASKEVQRSKRLRKMLEIILAFGNYMNRGQRGNAVGFKLSSLTRIADTKSSCTKNMTLLHYIVDTCEKKVSILIVTIFLSNCNVTKHSVEKKYVLSACRKRYFEPKIRRLKIS